MFGCSPKALFPNDQKVYDSIENYSYNYTEHTFCSYDKTPLHGLQLKPKGKPKGLIVVTNGLHENMSNRFTKWLWIVDEGYELFTFDYRSYGESEAEPDMYGFRDDVNSAIEYAHSLDKELDITLVGQSMGGTFVIDALATKKYEYVTLVVADSAFTSFASTLNSFMLKSIILIPLSWLPYTFAPDDLDSIKNIEKLSTPILFVTGDSDWIVNYKNSLKLYKTAKVQKDLWIVKGAGHVESFEDRKLRKEFVKLLERKKFFSADRLKISYNFNNKNQ